jgi:S-formylglutathione hydrolase FrmB
MRTLDRVSLLDTRTTYLVCAGAVAALLGSWIRSDRRWRLRTLPTIVAAATAATALIVVMVRFTGTITDSYPSLFVLWGLVLLAALTGLPFAMVRSGWIQRACALVAVPLALGGSLLLVNQEYGMWPRVADLVGHNRLPKLDLAALRVRALDLLASPLTNQDRDGGRYLPLDPPQTYSHFTHQPGGVYLPAAYLNGARTGLPVLVMLGGTPGTPSQWRTAGRAQSVAAAYAAGHRGVAPILVFVDQNGSATGDTECVDLPNALSETFLTTDVPNFVTQVLGIPHDAAHWGIAGFSEGGTCALDLVLEHSSVYHTAVDIAGDDRPNIGSQGQSRHRLFRGSAAFQRDHDPRYLLNTQRYSNTTVWFIAGNRDPRRVRFANQLAPLARAAGIDVHQATLPGRHDWRFARDAFAWVLPALGPHLAGDG